VRRRGIAVRIARKGVESSQRPGRHRWAVEACLSWLMRYRRLVRRYERKGDHFEASANHRMHPDLLPTAEEIHQMLAWPRHPAMSCALT
jgi:hypothetical protein